MLKSPLTFVLKQIKVHIISEKSTKLYHYLPLGFDVTKSSQSKGKIFSIIFGLLRKPELYNEKLPGYVQGWKIKTPLACVQVIDVNSLFCLKGDRIHSSDEVDGRVPNQYKAKILKIK